MSMFINRRESANSTAAILLTCGQHTMSFSNLTPAVFEQVLLFTRAMVARQAGRTGGNDLYELRQKFNVRVRIDNSPPGMIS